MGDRRWHESSGAAIDAYADVGAAVGAGISVGKRTLTGRLPRTTREVARPWVRASPYDRAGRAIDAGRRALREVGEQLDEARIAYSGRELARARDAVAMVRIHMSRAEAAATSARTDAEHVEDPSARAKLLLEVQALDDAVAAIRPEVEDVLRLAPPDAASMPWEAVWDGDAFDSWEKEEAQLEAEWHDRLDADEAARWAHATPAPLRDDQCAIDGPHSPHAFLGVRLWIEAEEQVRGLATSTRDELNVGPGDVGPYRLFGHIDDDRRIVYFVAYHRQRQQNEWVIGPADVDGFVANVNLYVGAARASLPGSQHVAHSQEDGAAKAPHLPSMLELEAFGYAPHQRLARIGGAPDQVESGGASTAEGEDGVWSTGYELLADGADKANGGSALVSARNQHIRLADYVVKASRLAETLAAQMDAGTLSHEQARVQAVEGRNQIMTDVRAKLSPAGRYASKEIKPSGVGVEAMTRKKVADLLTHSGPNGDGLAVFGGPNRTPEALRELLAEESPLWEKYRAALAAGDDVKRVFNAAVQDLGAQPSVSRAIVHSAGKSNPTVTGVAIVGHVLASGAAMLGLYDMVTTITDADEGERLHVAAGEFGGFAGGIVGAELGSMTAVWIASLLVPNPGAPVILIVSVLGGIAGGAVGGHAGHMLGGPLLGSLAVPGRAMQAIAGPGAAQNGGYAGLYERSAREGMQEAHLPSLLRDALFTMDESLRELEAKIAQAPDRETLEQLQRMRLDVLDQREQMGLIYSGLQAGALSEDEVWQTLGGNPHGT